MRRLCPVLCAEVLYRVELPFGVADYAISLFYTLFYKILIPFARSIFGLVDRFALRPFYCTFARACIILFPFFSINSFLQISIMGVIVFLFLFIFFLKTCSDRLRSPSFIFE